MARKITRLTLEELRETVPELSQKEEELLGGAKYFDLSGNYLGDMGPGDDLRVISSDVWRCVHNDQLSIPSMYGYTSQALYGVALSSSPKSVQKAVISRYAKQEGFHVITMYSDITLDDYPELSVDMSAALIPAGDGHAKMLKVKIGSSVIDNESSLISTIQHEMVHVTGNIPTHTSGCNEIDAIMVQIQASAYQNTSQEYKLATAEYLWFAVQNCSDKIEWCTSLEDAKRICMVY